MSVLTRRSAATEPAAPTPRPRRLSRIRRSWHADARRDRVPTVVADVVALTPIVGTVLLGLTYLVYRPAYYFALREDMPVEWLQFAGLLFIALLAAVTAWRARDRGWLVVAVLVLLAVGAFALAGEEISWGQRVFAFGTPEQLAAMNMQAETNVHNVEVGGLKLQSAFKLISFLLALGGLTLAWLTRGPRPRLTGPFWQAVAVPTYTMVGSAMMVVYWVAVVVAPVSPIMRFQEWAEASLYLAMGAMVYAISNRVAVLGGSGPVAEGLPVRAPVNRAALVTFVAVLVVTAVFAALTVHHGIVPLNNPEALNR